MSFLKYKNHKIYYEYKKTGNNNPLIIYLHGGPGGYGINLHNLINSNSILKKTTQNELCSHYDFLTYDQIGCGRSKPFLTKKNNTIGKNIELLNDLVSKFSKNRPVILYGDSYGTQLALLYTLKYPKKVKKILLTGLWLGSKKEVNSLYFKKAKKYSSVFNQIFKIKPTKNLCKTLHPLISNKQYIAEWNTWEAYLGSDNKSKFKKIIKNNLNDQNEKTNPLYVSIAFYESLFFQKKSYFKYALKKEEIKTIKCPVLVFQGINDEVCLPLPKYIKNIKNFQCHQLNMGHLDMNETNEAFILKNIK